MTADERPRFDPARALREGVRAVLLRGTGKHFSAGADLEHLEAVQRGGPEEDRRDRAGDEGDVTVLGDRA